MSKNVNWEHPNHIQAQIRFVGILLILNLLQSQIDAQEERRLTSAGEYAHRLMPIRLLVDVGHTRHAFIVDTGANVSAVDYCLEDYCTGEPTARNIQAFGDYVHAKQYDSIDAVWSHAKIDGKICVVNLNTFSEMHGTKISGILGTPFLAKTGLGYHSEGNYYYLGLSHVRSFERNYRMLAKGSFYYTSDVRISGASPLFKIDTGMQTPLCLAEEFFDRLVSEKAIKDVHEIQTFSLAGEGTNRKGSLSGVYVWGTQFNNVPVLAEAENIIGIGLLRKFDFRMNFRDKLIQVNENKDTTKRFSSKSRGIGIVRRNKLVIVHTLAKDGFAEKADIKKGDVIIAVNGRKVTEAWDEVLNIRDLLQDDLVKAIRLTIEREGKELERLLPLANTD